MVLVEFELALPPSGIEGEVESIEDWLSAEREALGLGASVDAVLLAVSVTVVNCEASDGAL